MEGAQDLGLDYVDSHVDEIQNINMAGRAKGKRPNVIVHDCDLPHACSFRAQAKPSHKGMTQVDQTASSEKRNQSPL